MHTCPVSQSVLVSVGVIASITEREENEADGDGALPFLCAVGDGGTVGDRCRRGREEEA